MNLNYIKNIILFVDKLILNDGKMKQTENNIEKS